jgi:hypothetical protein
VIGAGLISESQGGAGYMLFDYQLEGRRRER